jgi:cellulose synthase/poly-beta-1,6-N-acetylglucosamine synthase-like glycosyltransferase
MALFQEIVVYFFLFVGIYFQVFILFTFLLNRKVIAADAKKSFERKDYPSATIIVPCYNEEKTIGKTIESILALNYPTDKLHITVVNDGSKDRTWQIIQEYKAKYPQINIIDKENGGKHTALNLGIERATTELVGCLDADSFVDKSSLKKIACAFENPATMAVTPAMKIHNPTTLVQTVQSVEYVFGILMKKVMGLIGAIHVTPGPLTLFRRSMFKQIGLFRPAHNTEDMEIAFRMQANHLKIDNVHNAWVYTTGPNTFKKLYTQRVRWTYGFIQNARDYKYLFFNPKYGNVGILTIPTASILLIGVLFSVGFLLYRLINTLINKIMEWRVVGFMWPHVELNWFFVSTKAHILLIVFVYLLMLTLLINAFSVAEERQRFNKNIFLYFIIYPFIAPFWIIKSVYNAALSKKTSWR